MREQFEKLVKELCTLAKLNDAKHVIDGGPVDVKGTAISLIYNEKAAVDRFFIYADFGEPPTKDEAQVFYELLRQNFVTFTGKGPAFTVSPITGHVVYVEHVNVVGTKAADVGDIMAGLAVWAEDWRKTHFLSGPYMLQIGKTPAGAQAKSHT